MEHDGGKRLAGQTAVAAVCVDVGVGADKSYDVRYLFRYAYERACIINAPCEYQVVATAVVVLLSSRA